MHASMSHIRTTTIAVARNGTRIMLSAFIGDGPVTDDELQAVLVSHSTSVFMLGATRVHACMCMIVSALVCGCMRDSLLARVE